MSRPRKPYTRSPNEVADTARKRSDFLKALSTGLSVAGAAKAAKITRQTAYLWRREDEAFAREFDEAIEHGTDLIEDVAFRRAVDRSDTLLMFLLHGRRPGKFQRFQRVEHSGPGGKPIEVRDVSLLEAARRVAYLLQMGKLELERSQGQVIEHGDQNA